MYVCIIKLKICFVKKWISVISYFTSKTNIDGQAIRNLKSVMDKCPVLFHVQNIHPTKRLSSRNGFCQTPKLLNHCKILFLHCQASNDMNYLIKFCHNGFRRYTIRYIKILGTKKAAFSLCGNASTQPISYHEF